MDKSTVDSITGIQSEKAGFTVNTIFMLFFASDFDEELSEYAEENGIILIDGQILIGDGKLPDILIVELFTYEDVIRPPERASSRGLLLHAY